MKLMFEGVVILWDKVLYSTSVGAVREPPLRDQEKSSRVSLQEALAQFVIARSSPPVCHCEEPLRATKQSPG
jgi:hypothetical protein